MSEKSSPVEVAKQLMRDTNRMQKQAASLVQESDQLLAKYGMSREEVDRIVAEANFSPEVVAQVRREVEQQIAAAGGNQRPAVDSNKRVSRHFRKMA